MKRRYILVGFFAVILGLPSARGQSIAPSIMNATGGTATIGTNVFDWSVGETALVTTVYETNIIVTQGLLQNDISLALAVPKTILEQNMTVFPNPASTIVTLQYLSSQMGVLHYRLLDIVGQVIQSYSADVVPGVTREEIDISRLAVASYMLEVSFKTNDGQAETTSYKIQKLQ